MAKFLRETVELKDLPRDVLESFYNNWHIGMLESFSPVRVSYKYHKKVRAAWDKYCNGRVLRVTHNGKHAVFFTVQRYCTSKGISPVNPPKKEITYV